VPSLALLALTQAVVDLGRGLAVPVLMGLSIQTVAADEEATAMGVFQAVYALGMFIGPASAGVVAQILGLDGAFFLSAVVGVLSAAILVAPMPGRRLAASR
jgi:predicted MFS family arabinose efflux permease